MTPLVRELRIVYSPVTLAGPLSEVGRPADTAALLRERLDFVNVGDWRYYSFKEMGR